MGSVFAQQTQRSASTPGNTEPAVKHTTPDGFPPAPRRAPRESIDDFLAGRLARVVQRRAMGPGAPRPFTAQGLAGREPTDAVLQPACRAGSAVDGRSSHEASIGLEEHRAEPAATAALLTRQPVRVLHRSPAGTGAPVAPGLIGNDPKVGKLWEQATVDTLGPRYKAKTYQEVVAAYKNELRKRINAKGLGSSRKAGTGRNFARTSYAEVRTRFGRLADKAGISLESVQLHHTFDEIAKNPANALDTTNLSVQRGHAAKPGSAHNFAHEVNKAHAAGIRQPAQHVLKEMEAKGVTLDVPELAPSLRGSSTPTPKPLKGKKKLGGWIGLVVGVGIAGYTLYDTGDAYAAGQTVNPAANTTDTVASGEATAGNVTKSVALDVYYYTPLGTIHSIVFGLMGPQGEFRYDPTLAERALQEGRNPFCAQCHGPGAALDPNNAWNREAKYGYLPVLTEADSDALQQFLASQPLSVTR